MARPKKRTELEMITVLYRIAEEHKIKDVLRWTNKLYEIDGYNVREVYCSTLRLASDYFHTEIFLQKTDCNGKVDQIFKLSEYGTKWFFTRQEAVEVRNASFRNKEF